VFGLSARSEHERQRRPVGDIVCGCGVREGGGVRTGSDGVTLGAEQTLVVDGGDIDDEPTDALSSRSGSRP